MRWLLMIGMMAVFAGRTEAVKPMDLKVIPAEIILSGQKDRQTIVVQAVYEGGITVDVTANAKIKLANNRIATFQDDVLRPVADGKGHLEASFGSKKAKATVKVTQSSAQRPVSFRLDVEPVFMRAGCNSGSCHGSARGQDGFHLSLFGYDPDGDYWRITRQMIGRRLDLAVPEKSLLLEKSIGAVNHSGGELFTKDSEYYETVLNWIKAGAPDDDDDVPDVTGIELHPGKLVCKETTPPQAHQMVVMANYEDGSRRDITHLAVYMSNNEGTASIDEDGEVTVGQSGSAYVFARFDKHTVGTEVVVLPRESFNWPKGIPEHNYIDELVFDKLEKLQIVPSELSTDEEFMRRVYLDVVGLPPTVEEYEAFVADTSESKRESLVMKLLEREEFIDMWAMKWGELLQIVEGRQNNNSTRPLKAVWSYYYYVREHVAQNTPLDVMVRELINGGGSNLHSPQSNFYTSPDRFEVQKMAENVAQQFLGARIQCAQCHNHPFDRWTMDDYYGFTGFFEGLTYKKAPDGREVFVRYAPGKLGSEHPVYKEKIPVKFLGGVAPDLEGKDPRPALAEWMTSSENELFAQNFANRIWAHFFGRGIIEPVDDVRISNPPSNSELLAALSERLVEYDYDMKKLVRDILLSRTYQLSSRLNDSNRNDFQHFSHAYVRRLLPEVMLDTISAATDTEATIANYPKGLRATQLFQGGGRDNFLRTFGASTRESVCACEVKTDATLAQALELINGENVERLFRESRVIYDRMKEGVSYDEIVDELYIRALTRKPSDAERKKIMETISKADEKEKKQALEDVVWALINSTEFGYNH